MRTACVAVLLVCALVASVIGCGPSAQVKAARAAVYPIDRVDAYPQVFNVVKHEGYDIVESDEVLGRLRTAEVWYDPDGSSPSRDAADSLLLQQGSVILSFVVTVTGIDGSLKVTIEPMAAQFVSGSPQPQRLTAEDPAMPGFVETRIDELRLAIHAKLSAPAATP